MSHPAPLTVSLLALVLVAAGCSSTGATGTAPSDGFPAPDKEFVFNAAATALQQQGFAPDRESSSKQTWMIVTHWKTSLSPFSGQGFRDRATVWVHDVQGRPGYYYTETQVVRQFNENMTEPSNPVTARWERETRETDAETVINGSIQMYFLQGSVSDRFRQRYGVEGEDPRMPCGSFERAPLPTERTPSEPTAPPPYAPYGGR